jgi:putative ABC transport system substrate-binding protein
MALLEERSLHTMGRRRMSSHRATAVIALVALGIFLAPLHAYSQAGRTARIAVLVPSEPETARDTKGSLIWAFRQGLHELGYVEGQNIVVDYRYAHGKMELVPELITELVQLKPDVLVAPSGPVALAAKRATQTIPIVFGADDPVGMGLVASLARPGGNLTGSAVAVDSQFSAKWVELLKEAAPRISRVDILHDPHDLPLRNLPDLQSAAERLGLRLRVLEVGELRDIDSAFAAMDRERGGSFIVLAEPFFVGQRSRIAALATKHRVPVMYAFRVFVEAGGLISYGPNLLEIWRRYATYADRIVKGAKPGDLPIEQATKFDLMVNLRAAKALGLTIPESILLRADEVIR